MTIHFKFDLEKNKHIYIFELYLNFIKKKLLCRNRGKYLYKLLFQDNPVHLAHKVNGDQQDLQDPQDNLETEDHKDSQAPVDRMDLTDLKVNPDQLGNQALPDLEDKQVGL